MPEPLAIPQGGLENGQLPADWQLVRLGDVASLASGGTPSKTRPEFWDGSIPWASPKDLKQPFLFDAEDHISEAGLEDGSRLVQPGTLFLVVRGMILARDLPVSMAMVPMAFNQDMKAVIPGPKVDGRYLLYAFQHHKSSLVPEIGTSAHGTRRISTSAVENFTLPLPPLSEQGAIAQILDRVHLAKEATEKTITAASQLKSSLVRYLLTFGPVPVGEADHVQLKETEIGSLPEHWSVSRLVDLLRERLRNGHSAKATNTDSGVRTLTLTAVTQNDFSIKNTKLTHADPDKVRGIWLKPGDILVERANTPEYVGLAALYEGPDDFAIYPDLMVRVRLKEKEILPKYAAEFLLTEPCRRYYRSNAKATAGNFPKIDHQVIESTLIPLPPLDEQREIAAALGAMDEKIRTEEVRREALSSLFSTLLHVLMCGRLRAGNFQVVGSSGG